MRFADHLRSWSAEALQELFLARPDLLDAVDGGFDAVARRAANALSIGRCLIRSDVAMLVVAEALLVSHPATADEIDDLLGTGDVDGVLAAIERLAASGLVTVSDGVVAPVGEMADLLHRPLGLGPSIVELWRHVPPEVADRLVVDLGVEGSSSRSVTARAVARRLLDPDRLDRLLAGVPPEIEELLDALVAQRSPVVRLPAGFRYRDSSSVDGDDPVGWLASRGLLVAVNEGLAELPREVVIARMPHGLAPGAALRPIPLRTVSGLSAEAVAGSAADRAGRLLTAAEAIVRAAEDGGIALRRAGGVGVRELRRLGKEIGVEPRDAGRIVELVVEAGLVVPAAGRVRTAPLARCWWELPRSARWGVLVRAWHQSPTFLSRALSEGADGQLQPALSDDEPLADGRAARERVLATVAAVETGEAYRPDQIGEVVVWQSPNLWGTGDPPPELLVDWTLAEADLLGLSALDAPTAALAALVAGDRAAFEAEAGRLLGDDQGQIVIQSDLTAVSLGPLDPKVGARLADLAAADPDAGPTAYRFTESSLRIAFDRGWTRPEIEAFLAEVSLSGVPQPLTYLVADVERRYGTVRVHAATSVVVADDEATAVAIAATAMATRLGLRLVAPTVLVGPVDQYRMLSELRDEGWFPVLDEGTVRLEERPPPTTSQPAASILEEWTGPSLPDAALPGEVSDAVAELLAGDADSADATPAPVEVPARDPRLWNRPVVVSLLRDGELIEVRGVVVGNDEILTVLDETGVAEVPYEAIVSIAPPAS